jgi:23S rRNA G2445 N2-methylase RlmL
VAAAAVLVLLPAMARAQAQQQESAPPPATVDPRDAADLKPSLVEPDFTLINLPTTLRLPRHKSAFRLTHRFARTLRSNVGSLASDLFGLGSTTRCASRRHGRSRSMR